MLGVRRRLAPDARRKKILDTAVRLVASGRGKYLAVTRAQVARSARVSPALVSHYFGDMAALREGIMREAIRLKILPIIAQGIGCDCPIAKSAPTKLISQAFRSCLDTSRARSI